MEIWEAINDPAYRECPEALSDSDLVVVRDVERALADGLELRRWWERKEATRSYAEPFELVRTFNRAERVMGFFDAAPVGGRSLPVMGLVQEMLFDQPKQAAPEKVREELREFILHYFMRVTSFRRPQAFIPRDQVRRSHVRRAAQPFSLCPDPVDTQAGFGYSQLYYKLRGTGAVGKFPRHLQSRVVDLRRMEDIYEWVVLQVNIFNFNFNFTPFAGVPFSLSVPLREETYIALSRDFITNRDDPSPDLLGHYGLGYALLRPAPRRSIFAYGPGHFDAGFQLIEFKLDRRGRSDVRMAFVSNRPRRVLSLDLNPVSLGFGLADLMTFGLASQLLGPVRGALERLSPRLEGFDPVTAYILLVNLLTDGLAEDELCASLATLERDPMLLTHFMEHYELIVGALSTWRHVQ
ncbi:MAG TPA: hypothetical protein VD861_00310, partial [Pyrinomonadaceae bacterium]|nr:hypothetical protein [Pyrinomonadaceae bacterium]